MSLIKLGCLVTALRQSNRKVLLPRLSTYRIPAALVRYKSEIRKTKTDNEDEDELDKPIKFSSSDAAKWNAVYSRTGVEFDDKPWFQTYVIIASVATFLIYFCVLREENDIDQKLTLSLSDHFEGEQKRRLEMSQRIPEEYLEKRKIK